MRKSRLSALVKPDAIAFFENNKEEGNAEKICSYIVRGEPAPILRRRGVLGAVIPPRYL